MKGLWVVAMVACMGCAGVPSAEVRGWGSKNFGHYRKLVDEKFSGEDTRLNAYKSMASLICSADTADKKQDGSNACKCEKATSDEAVKTSCMTFMQDYQ